MNKFQKFFILSLIVSLPINIFGFVWLYETLKTYLEIDKYELTIEKDQRFSQLGGFQYEVLKIKTKHLLGLPTVKSDVQLIIPKHHINSLNANLPLSGSNYKDNSLLIIGNKAIKGKSKYRGDHMYHWSLDRKSWRFKTSKQNLYNGINKLNFIITKSKDMLSNLMSYKLAKQLGLLAPESQLVNFSVNGIYNGAKLMVEQIDESFLRKNKRMPSDIYKGDNIGQKKTTGVDVSLFNNSSIWEKASYNNHYDSENHKPLNSMIHSIHESTFDIYDIEGFAAMSVLIDITSSYHHDQTHNWMLSYDNYLEKTYPIIWDTTGWSNKSLPVRDYNISTSSLLDSLFLNYQFIKYKYTILNKFYTQHKNNFLNELTKQVKNSKAIIQENDGILVLSNNQPSLQESLLLVDEFEEKVINSLNEVEEYFLGNVDKNDYNYSVINKNTIRLSIAGSKLVDTIIIETLPETKFLHVNLSYFLGKNKIVHDISNNTDYRNSKIIINIKLLANASKVKSYRGNKTIFKQATYDLEFSDTDVNTFKNVGFLFLNSTNEYLSLQKIDTIQAKKFNQKYKNIINMTHNEKPLTWSGEKRFQGFTTIEENITIEKGTKLIFDEGATLKVLGKVTAFGTVDEPIVFEALDSSKPWGAFALKDERANGSVFKHVIFKGGSGDKGDLYEYTAMLSIHNVQDVLIQDSAFYDSKFTDDTVHVIYSDVVFRNSKFVRSLSDALDADISTIIVDNCEFINSGNDSIDLMTSDAIVINTRFSHSADKGISIGEGSNLLAINNLIENNEIGMQSKDTSKAYIYNTSFIGNKIAIDAYHKNWRYSEGGNITVDNCIMQDNIENATVGKKSKVVINNCQIDTMDNFKAKDLRKGKIVVSDGESIQADFESDFFQNRNKLIHTETPGFYER